MRRRGIRASAILAVLAVALLVSGCGLTGTPESGWVWPTTGPVTPAPTPLRVTPTVLPTPTARNLSPATVVAAAPTATVTSTPTMLPVATETATTLPTDTAVPPTETPVPPTETALPPTETSTPPPTDTPVPATATSRPPTATPVRGKVVRPPGGVATAVATAIGPLPVQIVPTPAPTPAFPIAEQFRTAWRDYPVRYGEEVRANPLGQPLETARSEEVSRQFFAPYQSGACTAASALFLWRESTDEILFLVAGNGPVESRCLDYWDAYPDTWATGQGNNEDLIPPEGRYTPVMGFGRVWREYFYGRSDGGLGFAVTPEQYTTATVQRFENGTAFYFPDTNEVYVLFANYQAAGPGGDFSYRAWFRNP